MHAPRGKNLYYRVVAVSCSDAGGSTSAPVPVKLNDLGTYRAEVKRDTPDVLSIFPNPASEKITVWFSTDVPQLIRISLIDVSGRIVKEIYKDYSAGRHDVTIDNFILPAGIYIVSLKGEYLVASRHVTIVR
jgi:hypothetical protein